MTVASNLDGFFKERYGDALENLVPQLAKLVKAVPFVKASKQPGGNFNQPVIVSREQGVTYAAAGAGAFALNSAVSLQTRNAQILGSQIVTRSTLDYESASRAARSEQAFGRAYDLVVKNMQESSYFRIELEALYGLSPEGLATTSSSANNSATTTDVVFSEGTWAPGIWAGAENATVQFYDTSDSLVSSGADAVFVVTTVTNSTRTVRITGTATGITALDIATAAGDLYIFFEGAHDSGAAGLDRILTNTGSLFGINAAVDNLWRANEYAVGGALTFAKVEDAVADAVGRGLNEDAILYVNPRVYGQVVTDQSAARNYDKSYQDGKMAKTGFRSVEFICPNGMVTVEPHALVKPQDGFLFPPKRYSRVGSTDLTFKRPGKGGEIFRDLTDAAGYEIRNYSFQGLFGEKPASSIKFTGITL